MEILRNMYFQHLIWKCGLERDKKYQKILKALYNIDFTYVIERDDNRESDGLDLRREFKIPKEFISLRLAFENQTCSVLEMLIGLAFRIDREFLDDVDAGGFLIEMVNNLFSNRGKVMFYREIVDKWLERDFLPDGDGSPFPVKHDPRDQRELEIWDQVMSYINEKY